MASQVALQPFPVKKRRPKKTKINHFRLDSSPWKETQVPGNGDVRPSLLKPRQRTRDCAELRINRRRFQNPISFKMLSLLWLSSSMKKEDACFFDQGFGQKNVADFRLVIPEDVVFIMVILIYGKGGDVVF